MKHPLTIPRSLAFLVIFTGWTAATTAQQSSASAVATPVRGVRPDTGYAGYAAEDVAFMSGMIHHHAQAILIAGWAPSHAASPSVRTLCERIVVAQQDEIALMSRWLEDRHEDVPDPAHDMMPGMGGGGGGGPMVMMPGMLSAEQLTQLDQARGPEFDRLFLRFMIQHHQGAITMVNQLFGSRGGGEQENVYKLASDVYADQSTEIDRMQKMLESLLFGGHGQ